MPVARDIGFLQNPAACRQDKWAENDENRADWRMSRVIVT